MFFTCLFPTGETILRYKAKLTVDCFCSAIPARSAWSPQHYVSPPGSGFPLLLTTFLPLLLSHCDHHCHHHEQMMTAMYQPADVVELSTAWQTPPAPRPAYAATPSITAVIADAKESMIWLESGPSWVCTMATSCPQASLSWVSLYSASQQYITCLQRNNNNIIIMDYTFQHRC